jgi:hypothetical protein
VNDKLVYAVVQVHALEVTGVGDVSIKKNDQRKRSGLMNPNLQYLVVAFDLVEQLQSKWGVELEVKGTLSGLDLEHCRLPLYSRFYTSKWNVLSRFDDGNMQQHCSGCTTHVSFFCWQVCSSII